MDFVRDHEGHEAVGDTESGAAEAPEQSDDPELLVFGLLDEEGGEHGANDPAREGADECCDGDPEDSGQQGFWEPLGGWEGELVSCISTTDEGDDGEQLADESFGPSGDDAGEHPAGCEDERPVREGRDNGVLHGKGGLVRLERGGGLVAGVPALAALPEEVIAEGEGGHGFDHWHRAREHACVVAASRFEFDVLEVGRDGLLGVEDGGGGFECDAEKDVLSIGDTALDASGAVGGGANATIAHAERVVVGFACEECACES